MAEDGQRGLNFKEIFIKNKQARKKLEQLLKQLLCKDSTKYPIIY